MNIEAIEQYLIEDTKTIVTIVTLDQVSSPCLLSRMIIDALGKPGIDNDLEFLGSGSHWEVCWSKPQLSIEKTREIMTRAIAPFSLQP